MQSPDLSIAKCAKIDNVREALAMLFIAFAVPVYAAPEESLRSIDPEDGWRLAHKSSDLTIYYRVRAGTALKEFKAVGTIDAPSVTVGAVIDDFENYPSFMPYTVECRVIKREAEAVIGYQRLSPKICQDRDYTLRVWKKISPVAGGIFYVSNWVAANELGPPERRGVVRVKTCDGGWLLEPDGADKTRATYSIYCDTGGAVPALFANHANQTSIQKLFAAVRKQATDPKYNVAKK
jgi:hypothetical protein